MNPFLIEDELKMKSRIFHISIQAPVLNFLLPYSFILFPIFHLMFMKMCYAECIDNEPDLGTCRPKIGSNYNEYTKKKGKDILPCRY